MEGDIIHRYGRREAIAEGVLIDAGDIAKEAGFVWPVAITSRLYHGYLQPSPELEAWGQSYEGRLWDLLNVLRWAIRQSKNDTFIRFSVLFVLSPGTAAVPIELISIAGPDDEGAPSITVLLPNED